MQASSPAIARDVGSRIERAEAHQRPRRPGQPFASTDHPHQPPGDGGVGPGVDQVAPAAEVNHHRRRSRLRRVVGRAHGEREEVRLRFTGVELDLREHGLAAAAVVGQIDGHVIPERHVRDRVVPIAAEPPLARQVLRQQIRECHLVCPGQREREIGSRGGHHGGRHRHCGP